MEASIVKRNSFGITVKKYELGYQIVYKGKSVLFGSENELMEIGLNSLVFVFGNTIYFKSLYTNDFDTAVELAVSNGYSFIYDWKNKERLEI